MKKYFVFLSFFISYFLPAQVRQESRPIGIGIRIGDFNGASIKYYLEDFGICLEANIGRSFFSADKYEKRFDKYAKENDLEYIRYDSKRTTEEGSFGYRIDIQKYGQIGNTPHLYWYAGTGFQARRLKLNHNYSYELTTPNSSLSRINNDGVANVIHNSYGIDFTIGGEYVFQEIPLSVFVDGLLFYEAFGLQSNMMAQFGLGARFQF